MGTPTAAYGRYCQSDVGLFSDNITEIVNYFPTDPLTGGFYGTGEGFDNQLRKCPVATVAGTKIYHTGDQDVEKVSLGTNSVLTAAQTNINVGCTGNATNDQGVFKVWIPDQADLLNTDIDISPLSDAPTLEGVAPEPTPVQNVLLTSGPFAGKYALELTYRRCSGGLAAAIRANNPTNPPTVILHLKGKTVGTTTLLPQNFASEITVGINGW
jgi:hypothetical protein